jgi:hypothetical protein
MGVLDSDAALRTQCVLRTLDPSSPIGIPSSTTEGVHRVMPPGTAQPESIVVLRYVSPQAGPVTMIGIDQPLPDHARLPV